MVEIRSFKDIWADTPALTVGGNWHAANLDVRLAWPTAAQPIKFAGHEFWLIPITQEQYPGIAINRPPNLPPDEAEGLLYRLLSVISWVHNAGINVAHMTGGGRPIMMGRPQTYGVAIRREFDFCDLPDPQTEEQRLVLALMREGRGLNHPGYAFLSFWRVIEAAFPTRQPRINWVAKTLPTLQDHDAVEALKKLRASGVVDVGTHLYVSGRCAMAHAAGNPIINPDDPKDAQRLREELPIVEALAVQAIEEHFGIETSSTVYRKHLYELNGWKAILGDGLVGDICAGSNPTGMIECPSVNVQLRACAPYRPFMNMTPVRMDIVAKGIAQIVLQSPDSLVELLMQLNFAEERIGFNIGDCIHAKDDDSVSAAENIRDLARFTMEYLGNGELQTWNAETGELVSRCDAVIPVNCFVNHEFCNAEIEKWERIAAQRTVQIR